MERAKYSSRGPLDIICASFPHESDGGLSSWVPDWAPPPNRNYNTDFETESYVFNANGNPPPISSFKIGVGGVLMVRALKIATVDYFGKEPDPYRGPPSLNILDLRFEAHQASIGPVFFAARELAVSPAKHMPHNHKPQGIRSEEFCRTLLFNHAEREGEDPTWHPLSDNTARQFCREIMGFSTPEEDLNFRAEGLESISHKWLLITYGKGPAGALSVQRFL
jgi:hypothetical protein